MTFNSSDVPVLSGLGYTRMHGFRGQDKDVAKAVIFYQTAAYWGDASALNSMGLMYLDQQGVTKNYDKALRVFKMDAARGEDRSTKQLASLGKPSVKLQQNLQDYAPSPSNPAVIVGANALREPSDSKNNTDSTINPVGDLGELGDLDSLE